MTLTFDRTLTGAAVLLLAACAAAPVSAQTATHAAAPRRTLVPRVDHHQHLMSERGVETLPPAMPAVALPPALERVLAARNRMTETGDTARLYVAEPQTMDASEGRWRRGREAVARLAGAYTKDTRFVATAYGAGGSAAWIAGVTRSGEPAADDGTFHLGLAKDARSGEWRIATEQATIYEPVPFTEPVTADQLIQHMDDAGIERAVVLSTAYWFGRADSLRAKLRAENDWTAAQVAKYPGRLVAFCGVNPLRDWAAAEVRRCARELKMRGVKLHFANSRVNLHDAAHVAAVRRVFATADSLGLALVVHSRTPGEYGRAEAEIIVRELLPAAPRVVVQVAHLWGGADLSEDALGAFADAVSSRDPRAKNLWFDLTEIERVAGGSPERMRMLAQRIRQIGVGRVLYGSDMVIVGRHPPVLAWARLRRSLPLTDAEMAVVAGNVAPYLR